MINNKYSFKDFMNKKFINVDSSEFNNTEIKGTCFYQESKYSISGLSAKPIDPITDVFPLNMTGVTFIRCNLDNVKIPIGNTIGERCSNRKIRVQNDMSDWELDTNSKPTKPLDETERIEKGVSIDPKDIPITRQNKYILEDK